MPIFYIQATGGGGGSAAPVIIKTPVQHDYKETITVEPEGEYPTLGAALAAVTQDDTRIIVKPGEYDEAQSVDCDYLVHILGAGKKVTKIQVNQTLNLKGDESVVAYCTFVAPTTNSANQGLNIVGARSLITENHFDNSGGQGNWSLNLANSSVESQIHKNTFFGELNNAIAVRLHSNDTIFYDNKLIGMRGHTVAGFALILAIGSRQIIKGNRILHNNSGFGNNAVGIWTGSGPDKMIIENRIDGFGEGIGTASNSSRVLIKGNLIFGCQTAMYAQGSDATISENYINSIGVSTSMSRGIRVNGDNANIANNRIWNQPPQSGTGIDLNGNANNANVSNNSIRNVTTGISVHTNCNDVIINGTVFRDNGTDIGDSGTDTIISLI